MSISSVILNTPTITDVYFYAADGATPLILSSPATYVVRTHTNLLIASAVATQDVQNAAHWQATINIPSSAPPTPENAYYTITWTGISGNNKIVQTYNFIVSSGITQDISDNAVLVLQGQPFTVSVNLPFSSLSSIAVNLVDINNTVIDTPSVSAVNLSAPPSNGQGGYIYQIPVNATNSANLVVPQIGSFPYFANISYTAPSGATGNVIPVVYVVTNYTMHLMNSIRRFVDRIRNNDIIPQLRITDIDLLHFSYKGLEYVNSAPPANFTLTLSSVMNLPQLSFYVEKAACLELLQSMYLGYGMSSFQFQGQAVQLDYEPTQFIQSLISELRTDLNNVGMAKNHLARSGGFSGGRITSVGGNLGPVSNWVYRVQTFGINAGGFDALPFF